jgi:enoyl-CoA hydratase/carnithine racemase
MESGLPRTLRLERRDEIAILALARPDKRNALDDETVRGIHRFFADLPKRSRAVI